MTPPTVVGVPGSLREGSHTVTTVAHALLAAERAGAETELLDLREYDLPLYHPDRDDEEQGDAVLVKRKIREADGVVLGSPVYHGSYSSAFRNVHDYCGFDEYEDTVVGLAVVAGGGTIASALDHMRVTVRGVHGWVVPHQVGVRNAYDRVERTDEPVGRLSDGTAVTGRFVEADSADRVATLGEEVVANLRTTAAAPACADD
jgi:NAD(P)H-dependent FMN reductase